MNKYSQDDLENFEIVNGIIICPTGDYAGIERFGEGCSFGKGCSFGEWCSFGERCSFGEWCLFGEGCSFVERCSFGNGCLFGEWCSFGKGCSFGEGCSFGKGCSFMFLPVSILRSRLGSLSDELTLELMRRDAWSHPHPEMFDAWAVGGGCPYSIPVERHHFFEEKKEIWRQGTPTMRDYDLIVAIAREKRWNIKI